MGALIGLFPVKVLTKIRIMTGAFLLLFLIYLLIHSFIHLFIIFPIYCKILFVMIT